MVYVRYLSTIRKIQRPFAVIPLRIYGDHDHMEYVQKLRRDARGAESGYHLFSRYVNHEDLVVRWVLNYGTEMKSSRSALPPDVAVPGHFDGFFSFPAAKGGYSGVAVYSDSRKVVPLKAEEGISGKLQPKPPLSADERVSKTYPFVSDIVAYPDEDGNIPASFDALDAEGRALVVDFGLFVLINVYCPNETSDARTSFKMNYHFLLEERVKQLMRDGREVIVLGDINICATPMDHCDGHLPSNASTFWDHPARAWFRKWLDPLGPMIDIVRSYWPDRKGLYTCAFHRHRICLLLMIV